MLGAQLPCALAPPYAPKTRTCPPSEALQRAAAQEHPPGRVESGATRELPSGGSGAAPGLSAFLLPLGGQNEISRVHEDSNLRPRMKLSLDTKLHG